MMRYLLPRLVGAVAFAFLAIYFVYREIDDRWLTGALIPSLAVEEEVESVAAIEAAPPPPPEPAPSHPPPPPPDPEAELKRRLLETQAVLARALEERLVGQIDSMHGQYAEQAEVMAQTRSIVERISERIRIENLAVAAELGNTIQSMESELHELDRASDDLDDALSAWSRTYRRLSEIGEISDDAMNERNYRFETYAVGTRETLADIVRNVERVHPTPGADLRTLIEMFNDIETRLRAASGRRGSQRVVANTELRIPIPRNAGGMIDQSGVSADLRDQRVAIESARQRQLDLDQSLSGRIDNVREFVARLDQLDLLARDLQESLGTLDPQDLSFVQETASPEQRDAWREFNQAFDAYSRVESEELRGDAARRLEAASEGLVAAYTAPSALSIEPEDPDAENDLEWFREYIERYQPPGSNSPARSAEPSSEGGENGTIGEAFPPGSASRDFDDARIDGRPRP